MTKAQWLACREPYEMVRHLSGKGHGRKLRLFAVACCRRIWDAFPDDQCRRRVEIAEDFADGHVTRKELGAACTAARAAALAEHHRWMAAGIPDLGASYVASAAAWAVAHVSQARPIFAAQEGSQSCEATAAGGRNRLKARAREAAIQADLLRCIVGNPFRRVAFPGSWRSPTAVALAERMYEARDFGAMPVLADALQEAGCEVPDILAHCRGKGPHARGCWVVDLARGQS
jgi:hypothetical protein